MGSVYSAHRFVAILAAASYCLSSNIKAADRIIFSDSTNSVAPAKPSLNTDDIARRLNVAPSSGLASEAFISASPSVQPISPNLSRKLEGFLDRKKNWMFQSENELLKKQDPFADNDRSTTRSIGGRSEWGADGDDKSDSGIKGRTQTKGRPDQLNPAQDNDFNSSTGHDRQSDRGASERQTERTVQDYLNPAGKSFLRDSRFADQKNSLQSFDRIGVPLNMGELDPAKRAERLLQQQTHDSEFLKMLQPKLPEGATLSLIDPIGSFRDLNRQAVQPFAPPSLDKLPETARLNPVGSSSALSSANPYSSDASVFGSGGQGPVVQKPSSAFSTVTSTFKTPQKPFVLEVPRRKF